jgi:hypothetical protein
VRKRRFQDLKIKFRALLTDISVIKKKLNYYLCIQYFARQIRVILIIFILINLFKYLPLLTNDKLIIILIILWGFVIVLLICTCLVGTSIMFIIVRFLSTYFYLCFCKRFVQCFIILYHQ